MKFSEDTGQGQYPLLGYGDGWINISGTKLTTGFALSPERLIENLQADSLNALTSQHISDLLNGVSPEVILLGTGKTQRFPASNILRALADSKTGFEIMNTGAACRTYNVLVSERRNVMAILFPQ